MQKNKTRKTTRDADGSVYSRTETRSVNGRKKTVTQWYARVRFKDEQGKVREMKRRAPSHLQAVELRRSLRQEARRRLISPLEVKTFSDLARYYQKEYLKPAQYTNGRKVDGLRSYRSLQHELSFLTGYFGERPLRALAYDDLRDLKKERLRTPTRAGRSRSIASVNRTLQTMRRLLNIALQKKWITENPFSHGDALISTASETKRARILTRDEEERLLAACVGARTHLRAALICALETGLRANEQFTLSWSDVDFEQGIITLLSVNAKTEQARVVPITDRLKDELTGLTGNARLSPRVFPFKRAKRAFRTACRMAGVENLRWHDLRHTAITWMLQAGLPAAEVMKISGHTQWTTFLRYVNQNAETAQRAAELLNAQRRSLAGEVSEAVH